MRFEGQKPPQFIINAAKQEDGYTLRQISSAGGRIAGEKRREAKERRQDIAHAANAIQREMEEKRAWKEAALSPEAVRRDELLSED